MARPLRIEYPGALYHVTSRGNEKKRIFKNDFDYILFLQTLAEVVKTHNWICYAYCLMPNHFHLLIKTLDANLSSGMRNLNGIYTQRFNNKHRRVGHLFQGRYKAFVIDSSEYFEIVARYVVINPVRAKLVSRPEEWRWSSYNATAGKRKTPEWLYVDELLECFSTKKKNAEKMYRRFVKQGVGSQSPFNDLREGVILGSERFVFDVWESLEDKEKIKEIPRSERIVGRPSLKDIFSEVVTREDRDNAIRFARSRCGYLNSEIAKSVHLDQSTVGKIVRENYYGRYKPRSKPTKQKKSRIQT